MKQMILAGVVAFSIVGCGGGGGGNGNGAPGYTHNQLADLFVQNLNASGEYSVTMAKTSTLKNNFIVIYDVDLDEYQAINIDAYNPGQDAQSYFEQNASRFFYDLDVLPGHYEWEPYSRYDSWCSCYVSDTREVYIPTRYRDRRSGFVFEKNEATGKDLETFAALSEEAVVSGRAESVATRFGLSVERSREVVRLAMAWKKAGGKDLTDKDQDSFSKELLGFSITEAKSAAQAANEGNSKALDELVEEAAETNGTTPENVRQIVDQYFVQ